MIIHLANATITDQSEETVFWIDEKFRHKGYGKVMLAEAERLGKELGCLLAHTCTFSYQSPQFYVRMGYEIFGQNDEFRTGFTFNGCPNAIYLIEETSRFLPTSKVPSTFIKRLTPQCRTFWSSPSNLGG